MLNISFLVCKHIEGSLFLYQKEWNLFLKIKLNVLILNNLDRNKSLKINCSKL